MNIPDKDAVVREVARLEAAMSDHATARNVGKMKELSHEHDRQQTLLGLVEQLERLQDELNQAQALQNGSDEELAHVAREDVVRLTREQEHLGARIADVLAPRDPRDDRDVILEIRAGAGGEEAALFAAELFRAYARYAENQGWKIHTVSTSHSEQGGFKEVIAEINAPLRPAFAEATAGRQGSAGQILGPFATLKFERGVHRVQRVPETEKMGRIHTSTVTVAVLPRAEEVDLEIRSEDLRIDAYRAGGAGGQHVNKTSSAIRITHLPTNTVVAVQDERSQHKNKEKAMSILRSRLLEATTEAQRAQTASERKAQVGTGDRSEKIRTYNFPQDRITDHRIKKSWSNIPGALEGDWQSIFSALKAAERAARAA